jgi:hypothetical protein
LLKKLKYKTGYFSLPLWTDKIKNIKKLKDRDQVAVETSSFLFLAILFCRYKVLSEKRSAKTEKTAGERLWP